MKAIYAILLPLAVIIFSCTNSRDSQSSSNKYGLELDADKDLTFPINDNTGFSFPALFTHTDKNNREYLSFMSQHNNSILFYDVPTGKYLFEVKLDREGPQAVGRITGYHIEDLHNIYLTSFDKHGLTKIDTSGTIRQFIQYEQTDRGYNVVPSFTSTSSFAYNPLVVHNNKIYITQRPYHASKISETPVSVVIDTASHTMEELPFKFPNIISDEQLETALGGLSFGRVFNGKQFLYSFHMDEHIYITDIETNDEIKIPVKSKYINSLTFDKFPETPELASKIILEKSFYRNILYDKYRNVYYRFTHIGVDLSERKEISASELWKSGPAQFSVIILDKDFNIIGETLFPKYTYRATIVFVHQNGLYISDSHILNPSFDENTLSFKCFTLKKKTGG